MLFNSLQFLIYFPIVVALYFLLPFRFRWIWLLLASIYFYMAWKPLYILVIVFTTAIDYFAGLLMSATPDKGKRKKYLALSLLCNIGILFFFKYYNFAADSLKEAATLFGGQLDFVTLHVILPLGISFHTFQSMAYAIDIYRGKIPPERNFARYQLYVLFFPQLVAGPIERPAHMLPQFKQRYEFDQERVVSGLRLMLWGFFQKVVIADNLAHFVDPVYNHVQDFGAHALIPATLFFAFQIFCDFAGYSNIAVGAARILGFDLLRNFNRPYASKSVAEFWTRWHISLSTWFKDYLYIPMGGNRVPVPRWYLNLMIVFLISGLWHGANWTFFIWGALHAFYMISAHIIKPVKEKIVSLTGLKAIPALYDALQVTIVFALVCFAWIFFRANTVTDAFYVVRHLLDFSNKSMPDLPEAFGATYYSVFIGAILLMEAVQFWQSNPHWWLRFRLQPSWVRWCAYSAIFWMVVFLGEYSARQFIYFVF